MKKLLLILALLFAPTLASAQCTGVFAAGAVCGNLTGGTPHAVPFTSFLPPPTPLALTQYHFYIGDASNIATDTALSGDCTYGALGIICTKTNNVAFGTFATQSSPLGTANNCLQANSSGVVTGTGAACGFGSASVRSITSTGPLVSGDCGNTLSASGGSFYAIGISGSYVAGCSVTVFNADPIPTGANFTGAKFINFIDCTTDVSGTYIYPQDSLEVQYNGSAWIPKRCPSLWMAPGGIFDINIDPSSGSDIWGVADGLATGSRAFASVNIASYVTANLMRGNFRSATEFTYKLCTSCTDSVAWHWPAHGAPTNSQGRAGVTLDCDSGTMSGGIQLFFGGSILKIQNCTVQNGVTLSEGAEIIIMGPSPQANQFDPVSSGYTFDCTLGSKIFDGTSGGQVNMGGGSGTGFVNASSGCNATFGTGMVVVAPITYSDSTIHIQAGSLVHWGNYGGSAVTGKKFNVIECGIIEGAANVPGSIAGTATCNQIN